MPVPEQTERLQKVLSRAGIGSRRQCEQYIAEGRVSVDGKTVTEMGVKVDPSTQRIEFNGKQIRAERTIYYLLNKPKGIVCTRAIGDEGRRAIDLLTHVDQTLQTVGRLDKDSEGLIILTNDGELINLLTHPKHKVTKTYWVRVRGKVEEDVLSALRDGVFLAEGRAKTGRVALRYRSNKESIVEVVLWQGMNRQVRRMFAKLGHPVRELKRIAIDGISDQKLKPGHYRKLTSTEIGQLIRSAGKPEPASRKT